MKIQIKCHPVQTKFNLTSDLPFWIFHMKHLFWLVAHLFALLWFKTHSLACQPSGKSNFRFLTSYWTLNLVWGSVLLGWLPEFVIVTLACKVILRPGMGVTNLIESLFNVHAEVLFLVNSISVLLLQHFVHVHIGLLIKSSQKVSNKFWSWLVWVKSMREWTWKYWVVIGARW